MTRRLTALCGALALLLTLGCGNKGPLYLPQSDSDAPPRPAVQEPEEKN